MKLTITYNSEDPVEIEEEGVYYLRRAHEENVVMVVLEDVKGRIKEVTRDSFAGSVSRKHLQITLSEYLNLTDLGSTNGTYLDEREEEIREFTIRESGQHKLKVGCLELRLDYQR